VSNICQIGFEGKWNIVKNNALKANFFLYDIFGLLLKFFILLNLLEH
jgi:hypothetical protein